jgi:hypothetical protein
MDIILRTPTSILRLSQDPLAYPSNPMPFHDPLGNMGGGPSCQDEPKREGPHFPESFDKARVKESLSVLQDLVFELKREVVDLNYRLQATDAKVASFLKILSSLHESLLSDSADTSPMEDPEAAKGENQRREPSPEEKDGSRKRARMTSRELSATRRVASNGTMARRILRKNPGQEIFTPRGPATCQVFKLLVFVSLFRF